MQSPRGSGGARTSLGSCTPAPLPGSVEALVGGRAPARGASRTLGGRGPRLLPVALRAGCRRLEERRHRGGREPPGCADARSAGRGQAREKRRPRRKRIAEPRPRGALTWARAARRGLLAGASVFLLALPLGSTFFALGHLAQEVHARRGWLRAGATRGQVGPRARVGLKQSFSLQGESGGAAALALRGGVRCRLRGAARTRRAVQATWG